MIDYKTTTDLDKIKNGVSFTWGTVVGIHTIGDYDIVVYYDHTDYKIQFFTYVNGKEMDCSFPSLDHALVACIAFRQSKDRNAADYFMKMIKKDEKDGK